MNSKAALDKLANSNKHLTWCPKKLDQNIPSLYGVGIFDTSLAARRRFSCYVSQDVRIKLLQSM